MSENLTKRLRSFAWRLGMVLVAVALDFTAKNLADFEISDDYTVVIGLLLGEVSKWITNKAKVGRAK